MQLIEFLQEIRRDIQEQKIQSPASDEQIFTDIVTGHMFEIGMTHEPQNCHFSGKFGAAILRLSGFSFSEEQDELDLYVSIFKGGENVENLPDSETTKAATQCSRFLSKCAEGTLIQRMDQTHEAFPMVQIIGAIYNELKRIRIFVLTDRKVKTRVFKPQQVAGKSIRLEVMDIERLFNHLQEGKPRDEVTANMNELTGGCLPCVWIPGEMKEYDYALTAIPGNTLNFLYEKYGARILEANVRSFLMQTGKVNKGIRDTMRDQPERFMAYNNGIVIIADDIGIGKTLDGGPGISWLKGIQIVNGGQTAASMYFTKRKFPETELKDLRVAAKIIVLRDMDRDQEENLISNISRYANSQNTVRQSDFWSNKPFHIDLEDLSRMTFCPDGTSRWFYERSTGSYKVMLEREGKTLAGIRHLKILIPPSRKITKTDLSKYECAWMLKPHIVSKGAQKNFIEYMEIVSGESEEERTSPKTNDFKEIVSKAILYRSIHKKILKRFAAFQANITAYTFSVIVKIHGERINLGMIWGEQAVSSELLDYACNISDLVRDSLENSSKGKMISEWAKKEDCWEFIDSEQYIVNSVGIPEIE